MITSGIHGVEGHAGSALQQLWLAVFAGDPPADTGVLLVHALNPYGFAHGRRAAVHSSRLRMFSFLAPVATWSSTARSGDFPLSDSSGITQGAPQDLADIGLGKVIAEFDVLGQLVAG